MAAMSKKITIRVSDADWNVINNTAEKFSMTPSEYVRQAAVDKPEQVFYDPAVSDMMSDLSDTVRHIATSIQDIVRQSGTDNSIASIVTLRNIEDALREINIKMRITNDCLEKIREETHYGHNETSPN